MSPYRTPLLYLLLHLLLSATVVTANTEKVIFSAPPELELSQYGPSLAQLQIDTLSPSSPRIRSFSPVIFANTSHPKGLSSWYILQDLNEGGRYEVRVCWSATPSTWDLEVLTLDTVFETPELIRDLARFAETRASSQNGLDYADQDSLIKSPQSLLFLRTWAAADFFTLQKEMMQYPPPVHIDLILDPFLFNVFPRSLLPTASYIVCIALLGVVVSGRVWAWLESMMVVSKVHME